jgi:hypothetical protein
MSGSTARHIPRDHNEMAGTSQDVEELILDLLVFVRLSSGGHDMST